MFGTHPMILARGLRFWRPIFWQSNRRICRRLLLGRAVEALIRRGLLEGIESPDLVFEISTAGIEYVEAQLGNRESEVSQYGEMLSRSEVDQSAKSSQKGTDVGRLPSTTQADLAEDKILARAVRFYEAEELKHRFGNEVRDRAATNGRAWLADLSHVKNHFVYGPYEPLDDLGPYAAWFKVKGERQLLASEPFVHGCVRPHRGKQIHPSKRFLIAVRISPVHSAILIQPKR